jgi:tetratricopeptide (TPR) repeat protein
VYLYETTVRVPLLVAPAGGPAAGAVVTRDAVSLADVAPTLLDLNGLKTPSGLDGRSLLPALQAPPADPAPPRRIFVEAYAPFAAYGWSPMYAVIEGSRKVTVGRRAEAFDLAADPAEAKPLSPAPDWAADLAGSGRAQLGTTEPPPGLREQVRRLVDDLDPPWNYSPICMEKTDFPDPRDRIALHGILFRARIDSYWKVAGRAANAARDEVLPKDPSNYTALDLTAALSLRNGWTEYLFHDLELIQCNYPLRPLAYHYYAHALEKQGDMARAEKALRLYALLDPEHEEPHYDLAVRAAQAGRKDEALDHLARSIRYGAEDLDYIRRDGRLASLREDPRFAALVGPVAPPKPSR